MKKIALYLAVSERNQLRSVERGFISHAKIQIRKLIELELWRWRSYPTFTAWLYEDVLNSNVGDIAIRESMKRLLSQEINEDLEFEEFQWGELDKTTAAQVSADCDLFLIGGSGYFQFDLKGNVSSRIERDLSHLRNIKVPKVAFGVGVNQNAHDLRQPFPELPLSSKQVIRALLDEMNLVAVRDNRSLQVLAPISRKPISVVPDPALLFFDDNHHQVQPSVADRPRIGINFAFHGEYVAALFRQNITAYVDFLKRLNTAMNPHLFYFIHSDPERVVPKLLRAHGIVTTEISGSPEVLCSAYSTMDVHVCQMLHSSILALSTGTPTVNLAYDSKNLAFYELMNLERFSLPSSPFDGNQLLALVRECAQNRTDLRKRILERKSELRAIARSFISDELAGILGSNVRA